MEKKWSVTRRPAAQRRGAEETWRPLEIEYERPLLLQAAPRTPGLTPIRVFGGGVIVLALLLLVMNLSLPWLLVEYQLAPVPPGVDLPELDESHRELLLRDDILMAGDYGQSLLDWPVAILIATMAAGLALATIDLVGRLHAGPHHALQILLLVALAFAGFLLVLTGTRWLGIQTSDLMSDSPGATWLHVVPYLNLAAGLVLTTAALMYLRTPLQRLMGVGIPILLRDNAVRHPLFMLGVSALGLLSMPLLPYAQENVFLFYLSEASMSYRAQLQAGDLGAAAASLEHARMMVWIILYLSLASLFAATAHRALGGHRLTRYLMRIQSLTLVPIVVMILFTILYHVRILDVTGITVFPTPFIGLTAAALIVAYAHYARQVLLPLARKSRASAAA